jgi:hypothetical protein
MDRASGTEIGHVYNDLRVPGFEGSPRWFFSAKGSFAEDGRFGHWTRSDAALSLLWEWEQRSGGSQ